MLKVLVIDDNFVYAKFVKEAIKRMIPTAVVDRASDQYVVKRRVEEQAYDVAIADLRTMDEHDAEELIKYLRESGVQTIIIWKCVATQSLVKTFGLDSVEYPSKANMQDMPQLQHALAGAH